MEAKWKENEGRLEGTCEGNERVWRKMLGAWKNYNENDHNNNSNGKKKNQKEN